MTAVGRQVKHTWLQGKQIGNVAAFAGKRLDQRIVRGVAERSVGGVQVWAFAETSTVTVLASTLKCEIDGRRLIDEQFRGLGLTAETDSRSRSTVYLAGIICAKM